MNGPVKKMAMALALPVLVVACAQAKVSGGANPYADDAGITTKVEGAFLQDPTLKTTNIEVVTYKSTVQLSGFVATPEMIVRAGQVARQVSGVSAVQNDLMVAR
jgi:osmotically-inducible protein OsmY